MAACRVVCMLSTTAKPKIDPAREPFLQQSQADNGAGGASTKASQANFFPAVCSWKASNATERLDFGRPCFSLIQPFSMCQCHVFVQRMLDAPVEAHLVMGIGA